MCRSEPPDRKRFVVVLSFAIDLSPLHVVTKDHAKNSGEKLAAVEEETRVTS